MKSKNYSSNYTGNHDDVNNSFQNKNGNVKTFRQNDMKLAITIFRTKIVKMKGVESNQNFTIF